MTPSAASCWNRSSTTRVSAASSCISLKPRGARVRKSARLVQRRGAINSRWYSSSEMELSSRATAAKLSEQSKCRCNSSLGTTGSELFDAESQQYVPDVAGNDTVARSDEQHSVRDGRP